MRQVSHRRERSCRDERCRKHVGPLGAAVEQDESGLVVLAIATANHQATPYRDKLSPTTRTRISARRRFPHPGLRNPPPYLLVGALSPSSSWAGCEGGLQAGGSGRKPG
jgi:hypothetical protein